MMQYKGYLGSAHLDSEAGVIRGRVTNTRDVITFQGRSVEEVRQAFRDSVDDYLEFCSSRGESPEKPYSGTFVVRADPSLHAALAKEAARRNTSLNKLVVEVLSQAAGTPVLEASENPRR